MDNFIEILLNNGSTVVIRIDSKSFLSNQRTNLTIVEQVLRDYVKNFKVSMKYENTCKEVFFTRHCKNIDTERDKFEIIVDLKSLFEKNETIKKILKELE